MSAGSGNLQGALHVFLSLYIGEVGIEVALPAVELLAGVDKGGVQFPLAVEELHYLFQVLHAEDLQVVHHCRFVCVLVGQDDAFEFQFPCHDGDGQCALDGLQAAVQAEFAHQQIVAQAVGLHGSAGGKHADGKGEVVCRTLLADVGGCHVDNEVAGRHPVAVDL